MKKLTKEQKRQAAVIAAKTDADIDLTDAREVLDWSGAEIGKFYRPPDKGECSAAARHELTLGRALRRRGPSPKGSSCIRWASRETRKRQHKTNTC
jgi:hypothetical protein